MHKFYGGENMSDMLALLNGIQIKLQKLIEKTQRIIEDNNQYINEIQALKNINKQQKERIKQLEEKNNILKLAKTLEIKEGNVDAKLKINELVREIEKCIGLLNT